MKVRADHSKWISVYILVLCVKTCPERSDHKWPQLALAVASDFCGSGNTNTTHMPHILDSQLSTADLVSVSIDNLLIKMCCYEFHCGLVGKRFWVVNSWSAGVSYSFLLLKHFRDKNVREVSGSIVSIVWALMIVSLHLPRGWWVSNMFPTSQSKSAIIDSSPLKPSMW